jgi:hypothetical protein
MIVFIFILVLGSSVDSRTSTAIPTSTSTSTSSNSKFYRIPAHGSYVGLDLGGLDLELAFVVTDTVTGPDLRHGYGYDHGNTIPFLFLVPDTDTRTVLQTDISWYRE